MASTLATAEEALSTLSKISKTHGNDETDKVVYAVWHSISTLRRLQEDTASANYSPEDSPSALTDSILSQALQALSKLETVTAGLATGPTDSIRIKSIFHECTELEISLSVFFEVNDLIEHEARIVPPGTHPLFILIAAFRRQWPFSILLNLLQVGRHEAEVPTNSASIIDRFSAACVNWLGFRPADTFTEAEVFSENTNSHIKASPEPTLSIVVCVH